MVSLFDLGKRLKVYAWRGTDRKRKSRIDLAKAFVAESIYIFETTDILIEYLKDCKDLK